MEVSSNGEEQDSAARLKKECLAGNFKPLRERLNELLDPSKDVDDPQIVPALKTLVSGGLDYETFEAQMKQHDQTAMCNKTLALRTIGYRCYTCATNDAMALCESCFTNGNHHGHDTRMYAAQGHGTCDCGNPNALVESGFCPHHGAHKETRAPSQVPRELTIMAQEVLPRALQRVLFYFRQKFLECNSEGNTGGYGRKKSKYLNLVKFIQSVHELGDSLMNTTAEACMDKDQYRLITELPPDSQEGQTYQKFLEEKVTKAPFPPEFEKYKDRYEGLVPPGAYSTMIEELVFFLNFYVFEEPIKSFILYLFGNDQFKLAFTRSYMRHYPQLAMRFQKDEPFSPLSGRMSLISSQLFVFESTALEMAKNQNALFVIVLSMVYLFENELETMDVYDQSIQYPVVNAQAYTMMGEFLNQVATNLGTILNHQSVAALFMKDPQLIRMLVKATGYVQGCYCNYKSTRSSGMNFIDTETYMHTFAKEDRVLATNMEKLAAHCQHPDTLPFVMTAIKELKSALEVFFAALHVEADTELNPNKVTYHLPLHRALAIWIKTAVNYHNVDLSEILPDGPFTRKLVKHLLHVKMVTAAIDCEGWGTSNSELDSVTHLYQYPAYAKGMFNLDMYLLQVCAMQIDADYFVWSVLKSSGLLEWLCSLEEPERTDPSIPKMLQSVCVLLASLTGVQTTLEFDEKNCMRRDLSAVLASDNFAYTEIVLKLPLRKDLFRASKDIFESVLKELAEIKMKVGSDFEPPSFTYEPIGDFWEKNFEPLGVLHSMHDNKYMHQAMTKYKQHLQNDKGLTVKDVWPPFKMETPHNHGYTNIHHALNCRTLHAFVFAVLRKAITQPETINDPVLSVVTHLLTVCVHSAETKQPEVPAPGLPDNPLSNTYTGGNILENASRDVVTLGTEGSSVDDLSGQAGDTADTESVSAKESIISLLFKCSKRFSSSERRYKPKTSIDNSPLNQPIEGGGGQAYIFRLLDHFHSKTPTAAALIDQLRVLIRPRDPVDEDTKRRERNQRVQRARERHLAKLQSDQKKFKKTTEAMDIDSDHSQGSDEAAMDTSPSAEYQCILCKGTEDSLQTHPIGVMAYLQASGVLGKRRHDDATTPAEAAAGKPDKETLCGSIYKRKQDILMSNYSQGSCELSINESWDNGVVVQTCGHYVHFACLDKSKDSQAPMSFHQIHIPHYKCPLCQQYYNRVMPVLPEVEPMKREDFNSPMTSEDIIKALMSKPSDRAKKVESSLKRLAEYLPLILQADKDYLADCVVTADNELAFLVSVVRTNLEVELMNAGGTLRKGSPKPMEHNSFNFLFRALREHVRTSTDPDVFVRLVKDLTDQFQPPPDGRQVPVFLRDPLTLLIYLVLDLPENITQDHFDYVANLLYGLVYANAALFLGITLTQDQQKAVIEASTNGVFKRTLQWMIEAGLSCEQTKKQETWSPHKVEDCLKEFCLPFLRISALLKRSMFSVEFPTQQADSSQEYQELSEFLKVRPPHQPLPEKWYKQLSDLAKAKPQDIQTLLQCHPKWLPADLIPLPTEFYEMFNKVICDSCHDLVKDPSLCLVCGVNLRRYSTCCKNCPLEEEVQERSSPVSERGPTEHPEKDLENPHHRQNDPEKGFWREGNEIPVLPPHDDFHVNG